MSTQNTLRLTRRASANCSGANSVMTVPCAVRWRMRIIVDACVPRCADYTFNSGPEAKQKALPMKGGPGQLRAELLDDQLAGHAGLFMPGDVAINGIGRGRSGREVQSLGLT